MGGNSALMSIQDYHPFVFFSFLSVSFFIHFVFFVYMWFCLLLFCCCCCFTHQVTYFTCSTQNKNLLNSGIEQLKVGIPEMSKHQFWKRLNCLTSSKIGMWFVVEILYVQPGL